MPISDCCPQAWLSSVPLPTVQFQEGLWLLWGLLSLLAKAGPHPQGNGRADHAVTSRLCRLFPHIEPSYWAAGKGYLPLEPTEVADPGMSEMAVFQAEGKGPGTSSTVFLIPDPRSLAWDIQTLTSLLRRQDSSR